MSSKAAGNLPAEATSFVGRRAEVSWLKRALAAHRVVTLSGPGGVGKTRLALEVAATSRRAFRDGVWLVELAAIHHGDLVGQAVCDAFGLRKESPDPTAQLIDFLTSKRLLVVLDNCEHVVGSCARLVGALVARAPEVRVLATSREVLGVAGEQSVSVPPLPVPNSDEPGAIAGSDGVALFVERARLAVPDFTLTEENGVLVARLCRQLDGIPLALELAAVRLRAISLDEIVTRLDDTLSLLVRGGRTRPERQQTLRATIDWSYHLCTPAEQALWQRLSVFAGGFTLAAAEHVRAAGTAGASDIVPELEGLVEKSIVSRDDTAGIITDRYRILEVLRQYGAAKLAESDREPAARRAHAEYYGALALRGTNDYLSPRDVVWFRTVREELPNIRAALEFLLAEPAGGTDRAAELAIALWHYWTQCRGAAREGYNWLTRALDRCQEPTILRVRGLSVAGLTASLLGDAGDAARLLDDAATLAKHLDAADVVDELPLSQAIYARLAGNRRHAVELAEQAAGHALTVGDLGTASDALLVASSVALELADYVRCRNLCAELLALAEESGAGLMRANAHWITGLLHWSEGDLSAARDQLSRSITLFRQFDGSALTAMAIGISAAVAVHDGDHERAAELLGAAHGMWVASRTPLPENVVEHVTGTAHARALRELGESSFAHAYRRGAGFTDDAALGHAAATLGQVAFTAAAAPVPGTGPDNDELTERQLEVARLVSEGLSNKDIADRLVISQRTAEAHVANILTKMGFRSRSQIAVWVSRRTAAGQ